MMERTIVAVDFDQAILDQASSVGQTAFAALARPRAAAACFMPPCRATLCFTAIYLNTKIAAKT
jgi:hypothetical protein